MNVLEQAQPRGVISFKTFAESEQQAAKKPI